MKKLLLLIFTLTNLSLLFSQNIGENADLIKHFIKMNFEKRSATDLMRYGELRYNYEVNYNKQNQIEEIIVEEKDAIYQDLLAKSDVRIRYFFEANRLTSISTNFYDLTAEYIRDRFDKLYAHRKLDGTLYFNYNYTCYRYIYWDEDIPTITFTKFIFGEMSDEFDKVVKAKQSLSH